MSYCQHYCLSIIFWPARVVPKSYIPETVVSIQRSMVTGDIYIPSNLMGSYRANLNRYTLIILVTQKYLQEPVFMKVNIMCCM